MIESDGTDVRNLTNDALRSNEPAVSPVNGASIDLAAETTVLTP